MNKKFNILLTSFLCRKFALSFFFDILLVSDKNMASETLMANHWSHYFI